MSELDGLVTGRLARSLPVRILRHALEASVAAIVASYAALIAVQVFYRYVLNSSLVWSEEVVRYGLLWGVMLGAALTTDRLAHVALDPLRGVLPPLGERVVTWLAGSVVLVFTGVLFWYGAQYAMRVSMMRSPAAQIPMIYVYAAIPTGAALIFLFTLIHLISGTRPRSTVT